MAPSDIPKVGTRGKLAPSIRKFLDEFPFLHLGAHEAFTYERRTGLEVFGFSHLPDDKKAPIARVEQTGIEGPVGTIPLRIYYPESGKDAIKAKKAAAFIYFHGGGFTIGSNDEFEQGLRIVAEESGAIVVSVEYHLSPEWRYPVQLNEYDRVIDWLKGDAGKDRGVHPDLVCGGGDSAGGNMTASICLRRKDRNQSQLKAQFLLYPEARLPFDTPASIENITGYYVEANGTFQFADHYIPDDVPPASRYVSPGMQKPEQLKDLPPAGLFTCGFDYLRDVGQEYGHNLQVAGNVVHWHHFDDLIHGFIQMSPWSPEALHATKTVGQEIKRLVYES